MEEASVFVVSLETMEGQSLLMLSLRFFLNRHYPSPSDDLVLKDESLQNRSWPGFRCVLCLRFLCISDYY
ncbi:hypothetical protein SAMN02746098_04135 [Desulfosporosinus lacus DSM 15449]|uniref:Uncharacterized protein n=1 Tax=Desulfosporosinus lacus DSM 15449 TaxID=1121420 RepID=A0A1M6BB95_9FIRM|nr:hypothetical protein SAMN02746098_04135 [Desulfosporosinus lacus DSM 15449]